jgi:peptide-methionine (S)-S-oxide reductase
MQTNYPWSCLYITMTLKINILTILFLLSISACKTQTTIKTEVKMDKPDMLNIQTVTLGGGCFWCVEAIYNSLKGVLEVTPGYSGGHIVNPTYKEVCTGTTGHAEVCQITYNSDSITFKQLIEVFFSVHDPTTLNRQGNDVGTQYRSIIFYNTPEQKITAENYIMELKNSGIFEDTIVTQLEPFEVFYKAEDYHNNYFENNQNQPYCQIVISPKVDKFKKAYKEKLK